MGGEWGGSGGGGLALVDRQAQRCSVGQSSGGVLAEAGKGRQGTQEREVSQPLSTTFICLTERTPSVLGQSCPFPETD